MHDRIKIEPTIHRNQITEVTVTPKPISRKEKISLDLFTSTSLGSKLTKFSFLGPWAIGFTISLPKTINNNFCKRHTKKASY